MSAKKVTYLEAISDAIREEMLRDEAVFLLGEDVGTYGGAFKVSAGLLEEFGPERVVDTPMSEAAIIGSAVGAALMGMRAIAEMQFIDFITCGFDQIINMASKMYWRSGRRCKGRPISFRQPGGMVLPRAGYQSRCSRHHLRRQGLAESCHPRQQPCALPGA